MLPPVFDIFLIPHLPLMRMERSWRTNGSGIRQASVRQRGSISSRPGVVPLLQRAETSGTAGTNGTGRVRSDSNLSSGGEKEGVLAHPVEPRATTATLPPVLVWPFSHELISGRKKLWVLMSLKYRVRWSVTMCCAGSASRQTAF